jgi:hypothetical protein
MKNKKLILLFSTPEIGHKTQFSSLPFYFKQMIKKNIILLLTKSYSLFFNLISSLQILRIPIFILVKSFFVFPIILETIN